MLCLSSLVLVVDSMALTVAVPQMTKDLGATAQDTQWILDSYILVFAGLLLTSGSLGDRFGRRKVMIIGLVLFGAASLAATLVASPAEIIAVRIAMGLGGALIMPSTLSIMITVFDDAERPKAMAAGTSVAMVGLVGSPVLGGVLIAHFSWHAIFFINIPVVALAIVAGLSRCPSPGGHGVGPTRSARCCRRPGLPPWSGGSSGFPGTARSAAGPRSPWPSRSWPWPGSVVWERVTPEPMVPLNLFRHRDFSGGSLSLALLQTGNGGLLPVLTQSLEFVLGYSPVKAALAFVPLAVAAIIGNVAGAQLTMKTGPRLPVLGGTLGWPPRRAADYGLGRDRVRGPGGRARPARPRRRRGHAGRVGALMSTIPAEQAGVGSALNDTIQQGGTGAGIAILGSLLASGFARHLPAGGPAQARGARSPARCPPPTATLGLVHAARAAFTASMSVTFTVSAIGVLPAAVLATLVMRNTKPRGRLQPRALAPAPAEAPELVV